VRRKAAATGAMLLTFALGMLLAVLVVGSASAAGSKTTAKAKTTATPTSSLSSDTTTTTSPGDSFFVVNGTVNAASDHEILGSSAFPNFTTGAVDNYYSMAHSHVDNSPFAEGTASPFDTGPIGQTAAAGNTQQPQYADARWPGDKDSGKATYGTEGQPYATAEAGEYRAKADASEAKNGLSGPGVGGAKTLPLPKGFDLKLRQALAGWRSKWQGPLGLKKPSVTTPAGTATVPKLPVTRPKLPVSKPPVTPPTVTTPIATVTTPLPVTPPPGVTLPTTTLSSSGRTDGSRSLAALRTAKSPAAASDSPPADGESLLVSSTSAMLIPVAAKPKTATTTTGTTTTSTTTTKSKTSKPKTSKTYSSKPDKTKTEKKSYALMLSGESSLGRVSLAGGQIVLEGIHVTASITNDGTPSYKANVSVASATIGGIPVTIDQDGVHVAGQGQGLPYQQASDALNGALKQAGIQLFLVGPEVTQSSCGQGGLGGGGSDNGGNNSSSTTTTSSSSSGGGQLGSGSSCDQSGGGDMCSQSGTGNDNPGNGSGGSGPALPGATPTSTDQTDTTSMPSSCGSSQMCDQAGSGTTTGTTTTSATPAGLGGSGSKPGTTTTTSSRQSTTGTKTDTTSTTGDTSSSCGGSGLPSSFGSCAQSGTGGGTTTTSAQSGTSTTTSSGDQFGLGGGMPSSPEMTVVATGVHVVFTQPVSPPGVPAQYVEHILGEVYVDSLATPAGDTALGGLGLSSGSSSLSSSSSSCGGTAGGAASGASASGAGGSAVGGVGASGSAAGAGSAFGSGSQPGSTSLPVAFATALRKPLWLLLSYLVWQALVIGTGWSLWNWRRGDPS